MLVVGGICIFVVGNVIWGRNLCKFLHILGGRPAYVLYLDKLLGANDF